MVKKIILTTLIIIVFLGAAVSYFCFAGRYCNKRNGEIVCNNINVSFKDSLGYRIITEEEIINELKGRYDVDGIAMDSLDLFRVEEIISERGEIESTNAYGDINGTLYIDVIQRRPVARIQNSTEQYYTTEDLFIFPVKVYVSVPLITGNVPTSFGKKYQGYATDSQTREWLGKIVSMAQLIQSNDFLSKQIEQIDVGMDGQIEMFTRFEGPKFIFGTPDNPERKFKKIESYFKYIAPLERGKKYSEVNLSFSNQIVCK